MTRITITETRDDGIFYTYEFPDTAMSWNKHEIETLPDGTKRVVEGPDVITITAPLASYEIVTNEPELTQDAQS